MLNSKRTVVLVTILLLICFSSLPSAIAQTDRGTITGTVNDPTGAVIVGAKVTATNTATRVVTETATTTSGNYTIPGLRSGTYDVSVEQTGFKRAVLTGILVQVGQTARVDAALQIGETSQAVEVTAETSRFRRRPRTEEPSFQAGMCSICRSLGKASSAIPRSLSISRPV